MLTQATVAYNSDTHIKGQGVVTYGGSAIRRNRRPRGDKTTVTINDNNIVRSINGHLHGSDKNTNNYSHIVIVK